MYLLKWKLLAFASVTCNSVHDNSASRTLTHYSNFVLVTPKLGNVLFDPFHGSPTVMETDICINVCHIRGRQPSKGSKPKVNRKLALVTDGLMWPGLSND